MKLKMIALAASLAASTSAMADIKIGDAGELFFAVYDTVSLTSYTLDLGVTMPSFFVNGQSEAGFTQSFAFDANFNTFLSGVAVADRANIRWAVMGGDNSGPISIPFAQGLMTTVRAGTSAAIIGQPTNLQLSNGIGVGQFGNYTNSVNQTGTHATQDNGSSVNALSDPGFSYFGEPGGTGPSFNSNFVNLRLDNVVGTDATFYYLGRSGTNNGLAIAVDQYNNSQNSGIFSFKQTAGVYSLDYNLAAAVPEASSYALMLAGLGAIGFVARRRNAAR